MKQQIAPGSTIRDKGTSLFETINPSGKRNKEENRKNFHQAYQC
jgi:hypothetical protein